MKKQFLPLTLGPQKIEMLENVKKIVSKYQQMDYKLTEGQLFYELVSQGTIQNKQSEYVKLCRLLEDGRMMGIIDWYAIEDRRQVPSLFPYYTIDSQFALQNVAGQLRMNRQAEQPLLIEVWTEKEELVNIFYPVTKFYNVNLVVNKDFTSCSAIHDAYERIRKTGKPCTILFLGDYDPSRPYILRDIKERLKEFGLDVDVRKTALTIEQILALNLPLNPAKIKKSRAKTYNDKFECLSWELEALKPHDLEMILSQSIEAVMNINIFYRLFNEELKRDNTLYKSVRRFNVP